MFHFAWLVVLAIVVAECIFFGKGKWKRAAAMVFACLLTIFFFNEYAVPGEIYRWTDKEGVIHFSDSPTAAPGKEMHDFQSVMTTIEKPIGSALPSKRPSHSMEKSHAQPSGMIDAMTGEFYPAVAGGYIHPRTGEFLPAVAGGVISSRTGQFYPTTGGAR